MSTSQQEKSVRKLRHGQVVTWGLPDYGGNCNKVREHLQQITKTLRSRVSFRFGVGGGGGGGVCLVLFYFFVGKEDIFISILCIFLVWSDFGWVWPCKDVFFVLCLDEKNLLYR